MFVALVLIATGILVLWHATHYRSEVSSRAADFVAEERKAESHANADPAVCVTPKPAAGGPIGVLTVPALALTAPVLEGVDDATLDSGVGHLSTSTWPLAGGTTVLEAHDVTFFSHIDRLENGDTLTLSQPCRSWTYTVAAEQVLQQGASLPAAHGDRIVLVTCWPTNALFFTRQRYVVFAELTAARTNNSGHGGQIRPTGPVWKAALPTGLQEQDLTLQAVSMPMGRMHIAPGAPPAWAQSAQPIAVEKAAIVEMNAAVASVTHDRGDWWAVVAPNLPWPPESAANQRLSYAGATNVTEQPEAGGLVRVEFDTAVRDRAGRVRALRVVIEGKETLRVVHWDLAP